METQKQIYRVDRRQIGFIRFIIEAYEGLAMMRTLCANQGIILVRVAPGCESDVQAIMQDLACQFPIETLSVDDTAVEEDK